MSVSYIEIYRIENLISKSLFKKITFCFSALLFVTENCFSGQKIAPVNDAKSIKEEVSHNSSTDDAWFKSIIERKDKIISFNKSLTKPSQWSGNIKNRLKGAVYREDKDYWSGAYVGVGYEYTNGGEVVAERETDVTQTYDLAGTLQVGSSGGSGTRTYNYTAYDNNTGFQY